MQLQKRYVFNLFTLIFMRMNKWTIWMLLLPFWVQAQKKVVFELENPGKDDRFYLASDLVGWKPADSSGLFRKTGGHYRLELSLDEGTRLEFKVTRGDWSKVECTADGYPVSNRELTVSGDTLVTLRVAGWSDRIRKIPKKIERLTADTLYSSILKKNKAIWVLLPRGYEAGVRKYPVIYLHDGQNLFDGYYTHNGQEWRVDETLDSLNRYHRGEFIVVGIGSDADRLSEYSPYPWKEPREISGERYLQFLTRELVPLIEKRYRTTSSRAIAGSSMGALISLEAVMKYPDVFQTAGLFSMAQARPLPDNSYVLEQVRTGLEDRKPRNVLIYYGKNEGESLPAFSRQLYDTFTGAKNIRVSIEWNDSGKHEEKYWQNPFLDFVEFFERFSR